MGGGDDWWEGYLGVGEGGGVAGRSIIVVGVLFLTMGGVFAGRMETGGMACVGGGGYGGSVNGGKGWTAFGVGEGFVSFAGVRGNGIGGGNFVEGEGGLGVGGGCVFVLGGLERELGGGGEEGSAAIGGVSGTRGGGVSGSWGGGMRGFWGGGERARRGLVG